MEKSKMESVKLLALILYTVLRLAIAFVVGTLVCLLGLPLYFVLSASGVDADNVFSAIERWIHTGSFKE